MSAFTFPQPGDGRKNSAAIPVPEHTLVALLAAAFIARQHCRYFDGVGELDEITPVELAPAIRDAAALLGTEGELDAYGIMALYEHRANEKAVF